MKTNASFHFTLSRTSLTGQLFTRVVILLAGIIGVIFAMMYWTSDHQINKFYDGQLITGANVLRALMSDEIKEHDTLDKTSLLEIGDEWLGQEDRKIFDAYATWRMFRVWKNGRLILASDTGPDLKAPQSSDTGFQTIFQNDKQWRIYSLPIPNEDATLQVGERLNIRWVFVDRILVEMAIPLLLLIPSSMILVWLSLTDGLRALRALTDQISQRGARDLRPLGAGGLPLDLVPLAVSVNDLLGRLEQSIEHERRFIDNAAHQIRTPLAALSLQAQLIDVEDDTEDRRLQISELREAVARTTELTEQLLTLARVGAVEGCDIAIDLREEVTSVIAENAVVAAAKGVAFSLDGEAPFVRGEPMLVRLVLSNLMENAVTYAPVNSEVQVILSDDGIHGCVMIADHGQGVPIEEREMVFERFFRGAHARDFGSGLGLAIVKEATKALKGTVYLGGRADGTSGLEVIFMLPVSVTQFH